MLRLWHWQSDGEIKICSLNLRVLRVFFLPGQAKILSARKSKRKRNVSVQKKLQSFLSFLKEICNKGTLDYLKVPHCMNCTCFWIKKVGSGKTIPDPDTGSRKVPDLQDYFLRPFSRLSTCLWSRVGKLLQNILSGTAASTCRSHPAYKCPFMHCFSTK